MQLNIRLTYLQYATFIYLIYLDLIVFAEVIAFLQCNKYGKMAFSTYSTLECTPTFVLYCNCCSSTTGYRFSCCYGMCLIQSDSQAVSACLSRTVKNPAGLHLMVCLRGGMQSISL